MQIFDFVHRYVPSRLAVVIHRLTSHHAIYHGVRHAGRRVAGLVHRITARALAGSYLVCRFMPLALSIGATALMPADASPEPNVPPHTTSLPAVSATVGADDGAKGEAGRFGEAGGLDRPESLYRHDAGRAPIGGRSPDVADPPPIDLSAVKFALDPRLEVIHSAFPMLAKPKPLVSELPPAPGRSVAAPVPCVPEPAGLGLFGVGAVVLGGLTLVRMVPRRALARQRMAPERVSRRVW